MPAVLPAAPTLEPADLALGLRYLRDYRVVVAVEPIADGGAAVIAEAAAFAGRRRSSSSRLPGLAAPAAYAGGDPHRGARGRSRRRLRRARRTLRGRAGPRGRARRGVPRGDGRGRLGGRRRLRARRRAVSAVPAGQPGKRAPGPGPCGPSGTTRSGPSLRALLTRFETGIALQQVVGSRAEEREQLARIGRRGSQPGGPRGGRQDDRHAVVDGLEGRVGRRGDDREGPQRAPPPVASGRARSTRGRRTPSARRRRDGSGSAGGSPGSSAPTRRSRPPGRCSVASGTRRETPVSSPRSPRGR